MKERDWPLANYARLARLLIAEGYKVHLLAMPEHSPAILQVFYGIPTKAHFGNSISEVLSILANATMFIGNDSGMAHIAELMYTRSYVIMSQYSPEFVFGVPTADGGLFPFMNVGIVPQNTCAPCYIKSKDYTTECHRFGCGALGTILPQHVMDIIKKDE